MTKYSMRHLLCIALFLLYCTFGCFGAVVQQLPQKGKSALQTYTVSTTSDNWQPIRIAVYTKLVEDVMKYCKTKKPNEKTLFKDLKEKLEDGLDDPDDPVEEFEEDLEELEGLCTDGKMTEQTKKVLFEEVLPKAIKLHADRLKVERKQSIPSENVGKKIRIGCHFFKDPLDQKVHQSDDFDFMIYVGLSAKLKNVEICTQNSEKRPTSAVIRFIPEEIKATRQYIRLIAHEIAHGLGFQHELMSELKMIETRESDLYSKETIPNKEYYMVNSTKTVETLKKHYNCEQDSEVRGLYLENENIVTPSHWERRIAKDELMSTYNEGMGVTGMYYSVLTLAAFEDMKFYQAVFEKAEPMSWGHESGCDFFKGKKDPKQTHYPNMFCKEDKKILQCTSDRFALGMCLAKTNREKLPEGYHYFSKDPYSEDDLMDGYPIIKPLMGTACEGGNETLMPGSIVSNMSRCLNLSKPLIKGENGNGVEVHGICVKVKCDNNKVSVLKGYDVKKEEKWHDCKDGDEIKVEGSEFSGETVKCPKYEEVCIGLLENEGPNDIKFYNGKTFTVGYDVNDDDETKKKRETSTEAGSFSKFC